jgi:hypothetical protein
MDINSMIYTYFIPEFNRLFMCLYLTVKQYPQFPMSRFIVVDGIFIVKLTYHCTTTTGQRWSFTQTTPPSDKLTFITEKEMNPLIDCLYNLHVVATMKKDSDDEYSSIYTNQYLV